MTNYADVTELAGDEVSVEQVDRVCTRYGWALKYCGGVDVLEIACGTGPGLGLLQATSKSLVAGDISEDILKRAKTHYGKRIDIRVMNAEKLPAADNSLDVVIIFEALYYISDAKRFLGECRRVLRSGGVVLVSNANKDLSDFNPSPYSHTYHGVSELRRLFTDQRFSVQFWGHIPVSSVSWRQKLLRPIKRLVVSLGLMPKSMAGKKLLKRLVFGNMVAFPSEITTAMIPPSLSIVPLDPAGPDRLHKVILCAAKKCD